MLSCLYDFSGVVTIDGVDLTSLPVETVRTAVICVPQSPIIFAGTIRSNLYNATSSGTDEIFWQALASVGMTERVKRMPGGLDAAITGGGDNLSSVCVLLQ